MPETDNQTANKTAEVIFDGKWHAVITCPDTIIVDSPGPMRFSFSPKGTNKPSYNTFEEEPGIEVEFRLTPGAWAREGADLMCRGVIIAQNQEIPVVFMSIDEIGNFFILGAKREKQLPF